MQITFHNWDGSARVQRAAASLGHDEVQVWTAALPADDSGLAAYVQMLNPSERERADRFAVREPRRQFVVARARLRQILGACLAADPVALEFGHRAHGKPFLIRPSETDGLFFNLSHSGGMMAIALARGREVGVDIELLHPLHDDAGLARRIFSPRELAEWRSLPESQRQTAFFHGWTRKEAFLKATGAGLTDDLSSIEVTLAPEPEPEFLGSPSGRETTWPWAIRRIPLPSDYAGAVVYQTC